MKKFIYFFFTIIISIYFFNIASAQDITTGKKNKAFFTIDVSGFYSLPLLDLRSSDDLKNFWNFTDYGIAKGLGTSLNFKFAVYTTKMMQLRTYVTLAYSHYSNDDNRAYIVQYPNQNWINLGWPYTGGANGSPYVPHDTTGVSNIRINNPQFAVGFEIGVYTDRANKSCFNFGLDYDANLFTGRIYQTYGLGEESFNTISPSIRFGLGINTVYAYKFDQYFGFHVGSRFQISNLFGKSSEMSDQTGYLGLLDKGNSVLNTNLGSGRTIADLRFFGGISIYLGKM